MKKFVLSFAMIMAMAISSHATVWRINNMPGTDADFTNAQAAHDYNFVLAGDTLYIEASPGNYGNLTLTKKLVIIGAGYFNSENPDTQASLNSSEVGTITFNAGSNGSSISGCTIVGRTIINASNIVIARNRIIPSLTGNDCIALSGNISNIIIRKNFMLPIGGSSYRCYTIRCTGTANNIFITNNYFGIVRANDYILYLGSGFSGEIANNVFNMGIVEVSNALLKNNIMTTGTFSGTNNTLLNNLGNSTQFGIENGNKIYINMVDVFVGEGSTDGQWQLKEGSPAIGAGMGGIDCGMFGGDFPYVLSGIPAIPAIYEFNHDVDYENQQIEVEIGAKSHN